MLKNILFAILLLLSGILGAGGVVVIFNSIIDDKYLDPIGFIVGIVLILLWIGTFAILGSKYFAKQCKAWLKFFGLTANEE